MIGQGTLVAPDVKIYTATHASDPDERLQDKTTRPRWNIDSLSQLETTVGLEEVLPSCLESQSGMV